MLAALVLAHRTEWKTVGHTHRLLAVGYLRHGAVVPLAWQALGKRGSSHRQERIALLTALFKRLSPERVAVRLGDREFIGEDFLGGLDARRISFPLAQTTRFALPRCVRSSWSRTILATPFSVASKRIASCSSASTRNVVIVSPARYRHAGRKS